MTVEYVELTDEEQAVEAVRAYQMWASMLHQRGAAGQIAKIRNWMERLKIQQAARPFRLLKNEDNDDDNAYWDEVLKPFDSWHK